MSAQTGKITQVIGPVIDVSFNKESGSLPNIFDALEVTNQKGIKIINTNPILSDAIRIGGTELFKTNLVKGKALPCAIAIKSKISKCLTGNLLRIKSIV